MGGHIFHWGENRPCSAVFVRCAYDLGSHDGLLVGALQAVVPYSNPTCLSTQPRSRATDLPRLAIH